MCWRDHARGTASEGACPRCCQLALLFNSCLLGCCEAFLHVANQALHVQSCFLFQKGLSWCKLLSSSFPVTGCVRCTCSILLCDVLVLDAQSRAGLVPGAEWEACCRTHVSELCPKALRETAWDAALNETSLKCQWQPSLLVFPLL